MSTVYFQLYEYFNCKSIQEGRNRFSVKIESEIWSLSDCNWAPVSSKEFLDIQANIECGFTVKRVRDMTRTYSHYLYYLWSFAIVPAHRMSQFQTLIRSHHSLLNIQTWVLVVFIDATMPMPELTND